MADIKINNTTRLDPWDGFRFAWGVFAFVSVLGIAASILDYVLPFHFDNSDNPPYRSGLRIKTDHLTGCQYFVTAIGAITPRMDADGKQICHPQDRP